MTSAVVDYENLMTSGFSDSNNTFRSGVRPRWERKKMQMSKQTSCESGCSSAIEGDIHKSRKPLGIHRSNSQTFSGTGDRFIPNRAAMDMEMSAHSLRSSSFKEDVDPALDVVSKSGESIASDTAEYRSVLSVNMLGKDEKSASGKSHRILSFKEKAPAPRGDAVTNLKILYSSSGSYSSKPNNSSKLVSRHIPSAPSRILDAPELLDDYYLNLLSWSDTNVLAVALAQTVYLWNAGTGDIQELCTLESSHDAHVSSVKWVQEGGTHLAIGTHEGKTQLWDVQACKQLRSMDGHSERVSSLSWNKHILSTGGRDSIIVNHDVRVARHNVATLSSHSQEVCGLAWSPDGLTLASGANDNTLCLWDAGASSTSAPRYRLTDHQAAVKALAWSPHERNLLASGGGTADRCIKFWNAQTGALLNSIDTGSQVCNLVWNPYEKEILSSHGFARNQLCLWKYPTMAKVKELQGHTARVLHMACSPVNGTVVSAAADETLRFWDIFTPPVKTFTKRSMESHSSAQSKKLSKTMHIR